LGPIRPEERLTRYVLFTSYYRPSDRTVKHSAFLPDKTGGTSLYRTSGLDDKAVQDLGNERVAAPQNKVLLGWIHITAEDILVNKLRIDPDNEPERHAAIVDWPPKDEQNLIARRLAAKATLHLITDS